MLTGIRQGNIVNSILFNKDVEAVSQEYRMSDNEIKIICYACNYDLPRFLYRSQTTVQKFNMTKSISKTESLARKWCKLAAYNQSLQQIITFRHLRAIVPNNRNLKEEVQIQTTKAAMISSYLLDIIWRNNYMNIKSKIIYKTCVRPVIIVATEARVKTITTKRLLRLRTKWQSRNPTRATHYATKSEMWMWETRVKFKMLLDRSRVESEHGETMLNKLQTTDLLKYRNPPSRDQLDDHRSAALAEKVSGRGTII